MSKMNSRCPCRLDAKILNTGDRGFCRLELTTLLRLLKSCRMALRPVKLKLRGFRETRVKV